LRRLDLCFEYFAQQLVGEVFEEDHVVLRLLPFSPSTSISAVTATGVQHVQARY
jgi:hypothetical protein